MGQMPDSFKPIDMPDSFQPITTEEPQLTRQLGPVDSFISKRLNQLSGEEPGILNPIPSKNPIIDKPLLPELQHPANEGWLGWGARGLYNNLIRPMTSPTGILGSMMGSSPIEYEPIKLPEVAKPELSVPEKLPEIKSPELTRSSVEVPKINVDELQPSLPLESTAAKIPSSVEVKIQPQSITPQNATQKFMQGVETAKPLITDQEVLASVEKSKRIAAASQVEERGLAGFRKEKSLLAGKLPKLQFEPLDLSPSDVDELMTKVRDYPGHYGFDKISAREGLEKIISGQVPQRSELKILNNIFPGIEESVNNLRPGGGKLQSWYDLPRGLMSVDPPFITSAAWRQGNSLVGTHNWFKGWVSAAKAYSSKEISNTIDQRIKELPLFKSTTLPDGSIGPSYAERVGLRLGDLTKYNKRDEAIRGQLAERIPIYGRHVAANNRAFNSFMNTVASGTFTDLIEDLKGLGHDPLNNIPLGQAAAEFVNTALKRGKLSIEIGKHELNLEDHAKLLANVAFSPRTYSSQIRMMNPSTYIMAPPGVRKQYIYALGRTLGVWGTIAGLSKMASDNVSVSMDPNSADFGKIRIGNTRIDLPGGMQQFLVLTHQMLPRRLGGGGITSTTPAAGEEPQFRPFGEGYKPATRMSRLIDFGANRLHPTAKYGYDLLNASESAPFHVIDKTIQIAAPMFNDDVMEAYRENPKAVLPILFLSGIGVGTQSYERGSYGKPIYWPEEYDINIGAKELER